MAKKNGAITTINPRDQIGFDVATILMQFMRKADQTDRKMAHLLKAMKSIYGHDMKAIYALAWRHVTDHRPRVVNTLDQVAHERDLTVFLTVISLSQRRKSSAKRNAAISAKAKKTSSSGRSQDELSRAATYIGQCFVERLCQGRVIAALQKNSATRSGQRPPIGSP